MIAIDTNVLVRALLNDDPVQSLESAALIRTLANGGEGIFIGLSALLELVWTLKTKKKRPAEIYEIVRHLLESDGVTFAQSALVGDALETYRKGTIDFGECLLLAEAQASGVTRVATYDAVFLEADPRAVGVGEPLKGM